MCCKRTVACSPTVRNVFLAFITAFICWILLARIVYMSAFLPSPAGHSLSASSHTNSSTALTFDSLHGLNKGNARGCIVYLAGSTQKDISDLIASLTSLRENYSSRFPTPVFVLVEGGHLEAVAGDTIRIAAGGMDTGGVFFLDISRAFAMPWRAVLTLPAWIFPHGIRWAFYKRGFFSYGRMCRFLAWPVFNLPELAQFDYLWRLDTDSRLTDPVKQDVFKQMEEKKWLFGYSSFLYEKGEYIEGLLAAADEYAKRAKIPSSAWFYKLKRLDDGWFWQFYNNFEIVSMHFMRSNEARALFHALDVKQGWFEHRWGDAPTRTIMLSMLAQMSAIHKFCDVGYVHGNVRVFPNEECANVEDARRVDDLLRAAVGEE
jgi:Glycolipid 2-alpha-mannosyltransferase